MFELRPYQERAVAHVLDRRRTETRRLLVVAPTGAGKATIAAELALQLAIAEERVLFVAHRRELILQAYSRFADHGVPERELGVIMAGDRRRRPRALVQIASIDTLRARARPEAGFVMVDECHRGLAKSYRALEQHYPNAMHVGLARSSQTHVSIRMWNIPRTLSSTCVRVERSRRVRRRLLTSGSTRRSVVPRSAES